MATKTIEVEIITIGDEILIGQIVDTNSAWMGVELNKQGFDIVQITSVKDNAEHITQAIDNALTRADVVLMTGGIGPTKDDITKHTLCKYFNTELVFSQAVYDNIEQMFKNRPNVMNPLTAAQAMVPKACTVIQNEVGTAPITWFEKNNKVIVSMPGVPYEMKHNMAHHIIPRLQHHFKTANILHLTTLVYGIPESQLAIRLTDWENALPAHMHLAYLPNNGLIKLRLSGTGDDKTRLQEEMQQRIQQLPDIIGEAIVAYEDIPLEALLGKLLTQCQATVATAESCTGGNIAHLITSIPGSSNYFKGSVVAYANETKINVLQVNPQDIQQHGAVSREVVEQMADGVRTLLHTDYAVATSGIAGPDGGTPEKPVGTIWIAVSGPNGTKSQLFQCGKMREQNINRSTQAAFFMLIQQINKDRKPPKQP